VPQFFADLPDWVKLLGPPAELRLTQRSAVRLAGAALVFIAFGASAEAACYGSGNVQVCLDSSGNEYIVNRLGNTTVVTGSNPTTGSQWDETVSRFGNTTVFQGQSNGHPWDMMEHDYNGLRILNGTNSQGEPFSYTCTQVGGCE
jgi:hypothetical protein